MKKLIYILLIIVLLLPLILFLIFKLELSFNLFDVAKYDDSYINGDEPVVYLYDDQSLVNTTKVLARGTKVIKYAEEVSSGVSQVQFEEQTYYVDSARLSDDLDAVYDFNTGYLTMNSNVYSSYGSELNVAFDIIKFKSSVNILDVVHEAGVEWLEVEYGKQVGYVNGMYVVDDVSLVNEVEESYVNSNNLQELDLHGRVKKVNQDLDLQAVYLDYRGLTDPQLLTKLAKINNLESVYFEYKTEDNMLASVDNTYLSFEQKIILQQDEFMPIITDLKAAGYKVIAQVSVGYDSVLPNSITYGKHSYLNPHLRSNWTYFVDVGQNLASIGVDEIVLNNMYFPSDLKYKNDYEETTAQAVQYMAMYIYDELFDYDINVSVSLDYFNSSDSIISDDSIQMNVLSNIFDNIYFEAIYNNYPSNTNGFIYPWNNPDLFSAAWAKQIKEIEEHSVTAANPIIITQAFTSEVYPYKYYSIDEVVETLTGFRQNNLAGGFVLYALPDDANSYDYTKGLFYNG